MTMKGQRNGVLREERPVVQLMRNGRYFWCEQATSYWETLFGLPEFCGC